MRQATLAGLDQVHDPLDWSARDCGVHRANNLVGAAELCSVEAGAAAGFLRSGLWPCHTDAAQSCQSRPASVCLEPTTTASDLVVPGPGPGPGLMTSWIRSRSHLEGSSLLRSRRQMPSVVTLTPSLVCGEWDKRCGPIWAT